MTFCLSSIQKSSNSSKVLRILKFVLVIYFTILCLTIYTLLNDCDITGPYKIPFFEFQENVDR